MDLFEQYQKDWKDGKANQDSNPLLNLKNKEIMDQLIRYEQEETRAIKKGVIGGAAGIFIGLAGALITMKLGNVPITLQMIAGIVVMLFSLLFSVYNMHQKEQILTANQNSTTYLQEAKEKLIARKLKIKKHYMIYIVLLMIGMGLFTTMLPYFIFATIVVVGLLYTIWDVEKDPHLVKHLSELDQRISDLK